MNNLTVLFWLCFSITKLSLGETILESCGEFASGSLNYCLACSNGFFSLRESVFQAAPFPISDCVLQNNSLLESEVFVSEWECVNPLSCNGSLDYPFDNLVFALDSIHNTTMMYRQAKVNIYLLGEQTFILEKDMQAARKYYFRRSLISLTISPFPCFVKKVFGCKNESEVFNINIKTNLILFFVSGALTIKNLVFIGIDMPLEKEIIQSPYPCYQEKILCCSGGSKGCNFLLNQTGLRVNKFHFFGLFNSEILSSSQSAPLPNILIENCSFFGIATLFPTDNPRFSSLLQIIGSRVNLTLRNIIVNDSSFADGLLKQVTGNNQFTGENIFDASLRVINVSLSNIKTILYEIKEKNSVILIAGLNGMISIRGISLTNTKDNLLILFDISLVQLGLEIVDAYIINNENVGFLICNGCKVLRVCGTTFKSSTLAEGASLFIVKDSGNFFLNKTVVQDYHFLSSSENILSSSFTIKGLNFFRISDFYSESVVNLGITVESLVLVMQKFIVLELSNFIRFISAKNSSVIFESAFLSYIETRYDVLVSMKSDSKGSFYILQASDGHFSNIKFFKDIPYNRIFDWPLFTSTDAFLMKNISVFNCTHDNILNSVVFFIAFSFGRVELDDVEFSYHKMGYFTLLFLFDFIEVKLNKLKFRNNERLDYYLIALPSDNSKIYITNVEVNDSSFTSACFYFRSLLGVFENISLTNVTGIFINPNVGDNYFFYYGLIIFKKFQSCLLLNWAFHSSEVFFFAPSRIFYFLYVSNASLKNISFYLSKSSIGFNSAPEVQLLASFPTGSITIQNLNAQNFLCQRSIIGDILYEGGIIAFFNSRTFLKDLNSIAQVQLIDVRIDKCRFCNNGVISLVNIGTVSISNITVTNSENINGGGMAIFHGNEVSIENMFVKFCSALQYGGALFLYGSTSIIIKNAFFFNSVAEYGGVTFMRGISKLMLANISCSKNIAKISGGIVYAINSNISFEAVIAVEYSAFKEGGFISILEGNVKFWELNIINGLAAKGGCIYAFSVVNVILKAVNISNSSGTDNGVSFFLEDCSMVIGENFTLINIKSEAGVGNFYVIVRSKPSSFEITNLFCRGVSLLSSILFYLENELPAKMNLSFKMANVRVLEGKGSLATFKSSKLYYQHVFLIQNVSIDYSSTFFNLVNENLPEQAFAFECTYLTLKNIDFVVFYFKNYLLIFSNADFVIEYLVFQADHKVYLGNNGRFIMLISKSIANLMRFSFFGEKSRDLAVFSLEKSTLILELGFCNECYSQFTSCFVVLRSVLRINASFFSKNRAFLFPVLSSQNSSLQIENSGFLGNLGNSNFESEILSNSKNIFDIFGKINSEISILRNCSFLNNTLETLICLKSSGLNISNCNFMSGSKFNFALSSKAIWAMGSDIHIFSTTFTGFNSINGGTLTIEHNSYEKEVNLFTIIYSTISNSTSDYGGAFSLFGLLNIEILNSTFFLNAAIKSKLGGYGNFGVGLFICNFCKNTSFILLNNLFISNYASNMIATLFSNSKIITSLNSPLTDIFDTNQYLNNSDGLSFIGNLSYFPIKFKLFFSNLENFSEDLELSTNNSIYIRTNQVFNLGLILLDDLGQELIMDQNSSAALNDSLNVDLSYFIISTKICFSSKAHCIFHDLYVKTEANKSFLLGLTIYLNRNYLYPEHRTFILSEPINLTFFTKPCEIGDIIIEGDLTCRKCPTKTYSLKNPMIESNSFKYNLKCLNCPYNAICPGGSLIVPQKGFWRNSNSSTLIVECLSKNSCLGLGDGQLNEEELIHGKCLENSYGTLCYTCKAGYGRFSKKGICKICASEVESYIKLTIIVAFFLIYTSIQIRLTFQKKRASRIGTLLKIIFTHFQHISLISLEDLGSVSDFKSRAFFSLRDVFAFLTEDLLPLECLLQQFGYNIYMKKVFATMIYPIALSLVIIFSWVLFLIFARNSDLSKKPLQIIKVSYIVVVYLLFSEVMKKCMSLFLCISIDDSNTTKILLYSPEVKCWSDEHVMYLKYAAVPGMTAWGIISPLIMAFLLMKNRIRIRRFINEANEISSKNRLKLSPDSKRVQLDNAVSLKFLFKGYSSKYFYWELLMFLKKFLLISIGCISDLFPSNSRVLIGMVLITFFLLIQMRYEPFESLNLNRLASLSLLTTFLTANIGILIFSSDFRIIAIPLIIILLGIHALFFAFWSSIFLKQITFPIFVSKFSYILNMITGKLKKRKNNIYPEINSTRTKQKLNFRTENTIFNFGHDSDD